MKFLNKHPIFIYLLIACCSIFLFLASLWMSTVGVFRTFEYFVGGFKAYQYANVGDNILIKTVGPLLNVILYFCLRKIFSDKRRANLVVHEIFIFLSSFFPYVFLGVTSFYIEFYYFFIKILTWGLVKLLI